MEGRRQIEFLEVSALSPIEGHGPKRAEWLKDKILAERAWLVPLKVERSRRLIMDGHHRFEVAKALGLQRVPAYVFSYDEVEVFSLRPKIPVSAEIIYQNHGLGVIFPYKTAKHRFPDFACTFEGVPLDELR